MILDRIVEHKKMEVQENKKQVPTEMLREKCENLRAGFKKRPFAVALRGEGEVSLIAEIKKASPSKGLIRPDFDPVNIAGIYSGAGAAAISVLTDREFFQGSPEYLATARTVTDLPLLRKDFIIDPCQIYEAKLLGADAVLLIMAVLDDDEACRFLDIASGLELDCLAEVHTEAEMVRALAIGAKTIGINNRDLKTFKTDLETTFRLREMVTRPDVTVVSESGINSRNDMERLLNHGVHAALVGEALMREQDIGRKVQELLGKEAS
ncbi:MAG: indole-3-glycerol phosphate synthase TrpC [Firmicutes bacterium HGW-Firmicutes-14]|nr:MAG: indole-3-glycerol phosphate synthase TrpC [Firmicutes bacterium HGW-Firmicutes-14]